MSQAIAPASLNDADPVIALWTRCGLTRPWNDPRTDFDLAMTTPTSIVLTAREGGVIVGSVMVGFDGHRGWVYYLAVDPEHRRGGLGRALMQAGEVWVAALGAPKIQLMIRADNAEATAFYEALGLEAQGVTVMGRRLD